MPVSPATFGAPTYVDDPTYDAAAEVIQTFADGRPIDFDGKTYAVKSNVQIPPNREGRASIIDTRTSWSGYRRTVEIPDATGCDLALRVHRGSIGSGNKALDAGVYVGGGTDFQLRTKLTGKGRGAGTLIENANTFEVKSQFWDLLWTDTVLPVDDQAAGVRLNNCMNGRAKAQGRSSGGLVNGNYVNQWFRGVVTGSVENLEIDVPSMSGCSQQIDLSGGEYNRYIKVTGGVLSDAYVWAVKLANSCFGVEVSDIIAIRAGYAAFLCSGPAGEFSQLPGYNRFKDCLAINPGFGGVWSAQQPAGYLILAGISPWNTYPVRMDLLSCRARDTQGTKTMYDAFRTQIAARKDSGCEGLGQINSEFVGPWTSI